MSTLIDFPFTAPNEAAAYDERDADNGKRLRRVLIVEDNPITQLLILQQLDNLGFSKRAASSGTEAIEAIQAERFDLILMDCRLPNMDGYETARAIRFIERRYQLKPATIVAVTSDSNIDCVDKCFSSGMDGHASKPLSTATLSNLLKHFLT